MVCLPRSQQLARGPQTERYSSPAAVIQFVIEKGLPEDRTRIIAEMKTQIFQSASHASRSSLSCR